MQDREYIKSRREGEAGRADRINKAWELEGQDVLKHMLISLKMSFCQPSWFPDFQNLIML